MTCTTIQIMCTTFRARILSAANVKLIIIKKLQYKQFFWHAYYASQCTSNKVLLESAKYIEKMLNHRKQSEGTRTLKPQCLVTVAMIYETNSDGTIFSLEGRTLNQPPPLQQSELNGQWLMWILMCLLHIQTPNLNCRWCQNARVGHHSTLLYSSEMVKEWITFWASLYPNHLYLLI